MIATKSFSELTAADYLELQQKLASLQAEVYYYQIDPVFNILSRQACDRLWSSIVQCEKSIVFFDIDFMHDANAQYGYEGVDAKIKSALSHFRTHELCGRWYSGDEFIMVVPTVDVNQVCDRLLSAFSVEDLSITVASVEIDGSDLQDNVSRASGIVQNAKAIGVRGCKIC